MKNDEKISIQFDEYADLLRAQEKLRCLEIGGVDNWSDYDISMEDYVDPVEEIIKLDGAKLLLEHLRDFIECDVDPAGPGTGVNCSFSEEAENLLVDVFDGIRNGKSVKDIICSIENNQKCGKR